MEEQVYLEEASQIQPNFQFYDPETKRVRGFLSEKINSDQHNRIIGYSGQTFYPQNSNSINDQCVNSIYNNNSSNVNQLFCNKINNSNTSICKNDFSQFYQKNQTYMQNKMIEEQPQIRQQSNLNESITGQSIYSEINLYKFMENTNNTDNYNYFKDNQDESSMNLESISSPYLNNGASQMIEEHTPTDLQHHQRSQYFQQSTPVLQNQESSNSNSGCQQNSTSIINNENIYSLESKGSASKQRSSGKKYNDRYIPNRVSSNLYNLMSPSSTTYSQSINRLQSMNGEETEDGQTRRWGDNPRNEQNQKLYSNLLQSSILGESHELLQQSRNCGTSNAAYNLKNSTFINYGQTHEFQTQKSKKLLTYSTKSQIQNYENELKIAAHNSIVLSQEQSVRKIPKQPYKILESHNLQDDFYLNLLDWSPMNYLAVGLKNQVAIWSGCNSTISRLCGLGDVGVSSVSCSQRSNHIAVGDSIGNILIYDIQRKEKPLLKIDGHQDRIGSIAWNGSLIASGSKDKNILVRDLRIPQKIIQKYSGHKQEICGLKWSFDENILASGGNDNKLFLWTLKGRDELAKFSQHTAAVKALGFSPHQHNILASGGGTADRCIRFWNTQTLQQIDCLDTGSQVCNLMFSKNVNEIVSTHGYSLNQIIVWKYPSMKKIQTLTGHTQRVLYLAMSPCGQNVVTGAGDETLRFWSIFPSLKNKSNMLGTSTLFPSCIDLR